MAPTTLSSFHLIETEKIGNKKIPQPAEIMSNDLNLKNQKDTKTQEIAKMTRNFRTGNNKKSIVEGSERQNCHSFFPFSNVRPRVTTHRPKDHDITNWLGTSTSSFKGNEVKITSPWSAPGLRQHHSSDDCKEKERIRSMSSRPRDHDASFFFGTAMSVGQKQRLLPHRPQDHDIFGTHASNSNDERSRTMRYRPKDHTISDLFGAPRTSKEMIKERAKVLQNHPKDHDISYLFGVSKSQEVQNLKEKSKFIHNRPKDHDRYELFGAEVTKSDERNVNRKTSPRNRPKDHDKSDLFGVPVPKINEIKMLKEKAKSLQNRPQDHDVADLFGALILKKKEAENLKQAADSETPGSQNLASNSFMNEKLRINGYSRDPHMTRFFLTPVPKSNEQKIRKIAKVQGIQQTQSAKNRPKTKDQIKSSALVNLEVSPVKKKPVNERKPIPKNVTRSPTSQPSKSARKPVQNHLPVRKVSKTMIKKNYKKEPAVETKIEEENVP